MEAAVLEMAEKGWGGLRTREVAERAGVNKGLVHYYFGSMDNLRYEVVAMLMAQVTEDMATPLFDAPTLAEGIRLFGRTLDAFGADDPSGVVLMEAMIHVPREKPLEEMLLGELGVYERALRRRIEADIASGRLDESVDAAGLSVALTAMLDGLALHAYMRPDVDFGVAVESLARLLESPAVAHETEMT